MQSRDAIRRWLSAVVFVGLAQQLGAQTLNEVEVTVQGDDVVVHVAFSGSVRLIQQIPASRAQFVQLQIELLGADDATLSQRTTDSRHVPASELTPEFNLVLSPAPNRTTRQLTLQFGREIQVRARQGRSPNVIDVVLAGAVQHEATAATKASAEVETSASALMTAARDAVSKGDTEVAIGKLNQLLLLPPNSGTQDAQEMIGLAWERSGDLGRARLEYELYLKLFGGEGAQRVRQRLASMGVVPANRESPSDAIAPEPVKPGGVKYNGNVAQYYFGGKSRSQSLVSLDGGIDQSTLTKTTESALVTNLDLGARYTTDESDTRAVFRGTGSTNLTATSNNASILNAAYIDYRVKSNGLALRLGRQSAINGGLLGMFDGASLTYPVRQGYRVNVMGGVPANPLVAAPAERLFAAMIEADSIMENLSGDIYIINQTTEGITNRRAIGTEARYSNEHGSLYALLDYDQLFRAVNAFTVQGSLQAAGQTTFTLLMDTRKAPSLQMTNALISTGAGSLSALLQTQTLDDVVASARATTAQARQILFSASRPISDKWQATGDIRFSDIGELPAVGNFEATPATGAQYGLSVQLTGSNIYSKRDINNFNLSYLSTPFFHGVQLAYNNLTGFADNKFTLEPSIRLYAQRDAVGTSMLRVTPGLRGSYNVSKKTSVMGEVLLEHSTNQGVTNYDTTSSIFFYFGVRHELF